MPLHLPFPEQPRHYPWLFIFFFGLPTLAGCCVWFTFWNPDPYAYYALIDHDSGAALFATKEEAEAAGGYDIEDVTM